MLECAARYATGGLWSDDAEDSQIYGGDASAIVCLSIAGATNIRGITCSLATNIPPLNCIAECAWFPSILIGLRKSYS